VDSRILYHFIINSISRVTLPDNVLLLIRHAETQVDKNKPVSKWHLTKKGIKSAVKMLNEEMFQNIDIIIASCETKALQTAEFFCRNETQQINQFCGLNELMRDSGFTSSKKEYYEMVKLCLENPTKSINNWEKASDALLRFTNTIEKINNSYTKKKILIVAHGIVINLYLADILGVFDKSFIRWNQNSFLDYAIIENRVVLQDIA